MKTIGITGGTGFIGRHLAALLLQRGDSIVIFTRHKDEQKADNRLTYAHWDPEKQSCDTAAIARLDAVVNLAGAGVADKRWTTQRKEEILKSRTISTDFLVSQLKMHGQKCSVFISASATGYYGPDRQGISKFTEDMPSYNDFLGRVCAQWEISSGKAEALMRTVILRFGVVLGKESGAYPKFVQAAALGILPVLGNGKQILSWVHIDDLCQMILFGLDYGQTNGIFNAVAPYPVSQRQLMQAIGRQADKGILKLGVKLLVPVPSLALQLMLGEMSTEVLKSCTASADKIEHAGFSFQYNTIDNAVKALSAAN